MYFWTQDATPLWMESVMGNNWFSLTHTFVQQIKLCVVNARKGGDQRLREHFQQNFCNWYLVSSIGLTCAISLIKTDQLDVTCFIISLFNAQHHPAEPHRNTNIHRTRYVITHTHDIRIYSGNIIKNTLHTRELKNHRTPQQPIFTETRLLKQPHTSRLITRH
jgi:hypothetical protein